MTRGLSSLTPQLQRQVQSLRKHSGYSVQGIAQRLNISRKAVSEALRDDLTPLNIRTTQKYQRCQEQGGCVPSSNYVVRPYASGYFQVPECKRCKVPMAGRLRMGWAA